MVWKCNHGVMVGDLGEHWNDKYDIAGRYLLSEISLLYHHRNVVLSEENIVTNIGCFWVVCYSSWIVVVWMVFGTCPMPCICICCKSLEVNIYSLFSSKKYVYWHMYDLNFSIFFSKIFFFHRHLIMLGRMMYEITLY